MEFDSEESAYQFYNKYAYGTGFSIRRSSVHKTWDGNIIDRLFCCSCEGQRGEDKRDMNVKSHRPETRTSCGAHMKISARHTSKYKVVKFAAEHNGHNLVSPGKCHFLRSQRSISKQQATQIDNIDNFGIPPKAGLDYIARQVGGCENVGFILEDMKNYLHSKRTMQMKEGGASGVLNYLRKKQSQDLNFFYAIQVDQDDLITNIFWADAQMKADYEFFGDAVSFDTTYRKNKEERPFALFVDVNHHNQTTVFGASLLFDETTESFTWLFDTFAKAMNEKKPTTIITYQDAAMARALEEIWPGTCHRLCIWHIYQNAAKHLSNIFARFGDFSKDLRSCIYGYEEEEEFLNAWQEMLGKYGLQNNEWLDKLYRKKEKWAMVYGRQTFCANMISTQRSESMNSALKKYVNYKHSHLQFFYHFDRLVFDRRFKEIQADLRTCHSTQKLSLEVEILKHARSVYTNEIFLLFHAEVSKGYDSNLEIISESEDVHQYKITPLEIQYHHTVSFVASDVKVSCSCKKVEFAGILCSHALKVLTTKGVLQIPEIYIKKRWTKKAKKGIILTSSQPSSVMNEATMGMKEDNEKTMIRKHYRELCRLVNHLTIRDASTNETFDITRVGLIKMIEKVDSVLEEKPLANPVPKQVLGPNQAVQKSCISKAREKQSHASGESEPSQGIGNVLKKAGSSEITIQGLKRKPNCKKKSGKRMKNGLEQATGNGKRRLKPKNNSSGRSSLSDAFKNNE